MGQRVVDRRRQEYLRSGTVTVRASVLKGVSGMVGLLLLAVLCAGLSYDAFQRDGVSSFKGWGCSLTALLCLVGILVTTAPMVRRRRLVLDGSGLEVSARTKGARTQELSLQWGEIEQIGAHRNTNGEGTTTVDVRMFLVPGAGHGTGTTGAKGHVDLPTGFAMSRKDLAALMEWIRSSQTQGHALG